MSACNPDMRLCVRCGTEFYRRQRDSAAQWRGRRYCGMACANKSNADAKVVPMSEKFWQYVVTMKSGCWRWNGPTDNQGYGRVGERRNNQKKAHRLSWEIHFGLIPDGMVIIHACDNPPCTNPDHLMLGTQKANAVDCSKKSRNNPISMRNLNHG